jgi:hypothetical protein
LPHFRSHGIIIATKNDFTNRPLAEIQMIVLKMITVLLGLAFTLFGYFIYFKKKYNLINGFEAEFKAGKKDELYAKRVGMIEFVIGIVFMIVGIILIIFA